MQGFGNFLPGHFFCIGIQNVRLLTGEYNELHRQPLCTGLTWVLLMWPCAAKELHHPRDNWTRCPIFQVTRQRHLILVNIIFGIKDGGKALTRFIEETNISPRKITRSRPTGPGRVFGPTSLTLYKYKEIHNPTIAYNCYVST
jgi:hypothetical protein